MSTSSSTIAAPACPEWCTLPRDHDPEDAALGGRVHISRDFDGELVTYEDMPIVDAEAWGFSLPAPTMYGATAEELARRLREHVEAVEEVAHWLECLKRREALADFFGDRPATDFIRVKGGHVHAIDDSVIRMDTGTLRFTSVCGRWLEADRCEPEATAAVPFCEACARKLESNR